MEDTLVTEPEISREDQIRAIGFDPGHMTPEEQAELLEIYQLCPDEALV